MSVRASRWNEKCHSCYVYVDFIKTGTLSSICEVLKKAKAKECPCQDCLLKMICNDQCELYYDKAIGCVNN